ncbi:MAG: agmatinase [Candidatus Nezhaarchaeota archaeon]|nr:agmatinase [Candidatus Nezhaarchaeota archaeon]
MEELDIFVNPSPYVFKGAQAPFTSAKVVILGAPFDSTSTYRPGSRFAPSAIREASANIEGYSWRAKIDSEVVATHDLGDLVVVQGDTRATLSRLERIAQRLRGAGKLPIIVGGEHTIAYGAVVGLGKPALLCFDAHLDLRDEYPAGIKLSHATVVRRLIEVLGCGAVFMVGVRAACLEEVKYVEEKGLRILTSWEVEELGPVEVARRIREWALRFDKLYVSIDLDALDPSYAPGVANPEPEGLRPSLLLDVLNLTLDQRVVGLDLVEVSPPYDNGLASIHAAKILLEAVAYLSRRATRP